MTRVSHLLDDFGMGGVTRALTLFERPELKRIASSDILQVRSNSMLAPKVEADVIVDHMSASWRRLPFLASLRARNRHARIVRVEHSYTRGFELTQVKARGRFRSLLRISAQLADEVVCVSRAQREWLTGEVGLASHRVRTIYPWSGRTELFDIDPQEGETKRPLQLLAYGRYAEVKNFAELIVAMRSFRPEDVRLTLFGDGPQRSLLEALAADLPHVQVFGPQDDPATWLGTCDAVILPSRYEAFGLVATEARMAARPVIVANIDGLPEQARDGGIIADLSSAYEIAQAIRRAKSEPLSKLGRMARCKVRGQHKAILNDWTQLLQQGAGKRRSRAAQMPLRPRKAMV